MFRTRQRPLDRLASPFLRTAIPDRKERTNALTTIVLIASGPGVPVCAETTSVSTARRELDQQIEPLSQSLDFARAAIGGAVINVGSGERRHDSLDVLGARGSNLPARIILVGMMGVGKTTIGRGLASQLEWPFYDNDELVTEVYGRSGPEIFRSEGELALHEAERAAFEVALEKAPPAVVTAAGCVVDDPHSRDRLATAGWVIWLDAEPGVLAGRIGNGRGRRSDATDVALLTSLRGRRADLWSRLAHQCITIDNLSPDEIVHRITSARGQG